MSFPWLLVIAGLIGLFIVLPAVLVAVQAERRGYSLQGWFQAAGFGLNPLFALLALAMLPDRARLLLRQRFREELDARLAALPAAVPALAAVTEGVTPAVSVGDRPTVLPEASVPQQRSLGDQTTSLPQRSLGDEETRL
jgi:hypothetical protein